MIDLTHATPDPSNYAEYVRQRMVRTNKAMETMNIISGSYCKQNNLSVRLLFDNDYKYDAITDSMVKE